MDKFVTVLETRFGKALADCLLLVMGLGIVAWAGHAFVFDFAMPIATLLGAAFDTHGHATKPEVFASIARVGFIAALAVTTISALRFLGRQWLRKEREIRDEALGLLDRVRRATEDIRISAQLSQAKLCDEAKRNEELLQDKREEILHLGGRIVSQAERLIPLLAAADNRLTVLIEREQFLRSEIHSGNDVVTSAIPEFDPAIAGPAPASSSLHASGVG